jgi:flagellar FliL protein
MAEHKKEGGEEKKSSKKLIIIMVAAVVLLAGGGGAGYFFFMRGHDAENVEGDKESEHKEEGKKEHDEGEKSEDEEHADAEKLYFDLGKPLVVDFSKAAAVRFVSISLSFLVEGAETVDALKKNEPMIRNNLLMLINAQGVESLKTREGKEKLRAAILTDVAGVLEKMAGKGRVTEVFFTAFVMQ